MQILGGELVRSDLTKNARGGSELMAERLHASLPKDLLKEFQIVLSREVPLDETKLRVFWAHDLPGDQGANFLQNEGWSKFHAIVFVSYWQRDQFIRYYNIPFSKCVVLRNAIEPFNLADRTESDIIRFIYHTTPHRGLHILIGVFDVLSKSERWKNKIHLDVYSSFGVYGWNDKDKPYEELFKFVMQHDHMTYHGAVSNDEVRKALLNSDVFAYPCIWPETSCLALIEAMSAGLVCIHSDYAALQETSANWNHTYAMTENEEGHARRLHNRLESFLPELNTLKGRAVMASDYVNAFYDINNRALQWEALLRGMLNAPREFPKPKSEDVFLYKR